MNMDELVVKKARWTVPSKKRSAISLIFRMACPQLCPWEYPLLGQEAFME